jgi:uncharacterized protein with HEPN domain
MVYLGKKNKIQNSRARSISEVKWRDWAELRDAASVESVLDGLSVVHIVNPHVKLKRLNIRNNKLMKK